MSVRSVPTVVQLFTGFSTVALSGFGGVLPIARRTLVEKRGWLDEAEFVELLSLGQLLPGPNIVNLAVMLGDRRRGLPGALAALAGLLAGAGGLSLLPLAAGVAAYLAPMVLMTAGYALFQTANNSGVMHGVATAQRGVVAGMLNVARNLGLMSGASLMGAVFAWGAGASDLTHAPPDALAAGMHATFGLAALGLAAMLAIAGRRQAA